MGKVKRDSFVQREMRLAKAAVKGDEVAWNELYAFSYPKVRSYIYPRMIDVNDLDDTLQDIFIQAHRKLKQFKGQGRFNSWVLSISHNQTLMNFRKERRRRKHRTIFNYANLENYPEPTPFMERMHNRFSIRKAFSELPPRRKKHFHCVAVDGLTHDEVAKLLSCHRETGKTQYFKARKQLRRTLLAWGETYPLSGGKLARCVAVGRGRPQGGNKRLQSLLGGTVAPRR